MFPLTPQECVFFDELGRYFPGWREVTEVSERPVRSPEVHVSGVGRAPEASASGGTPDASVTSQSTLFDKEAA